MVEELTKALEKYNDRVNNVSHENLTKKYLQFFQDDIESKLTNIQSLPHNEVKKTAVRRVHSDITALQTPSAEVLSIQRREKLRRTYSENPNEERQRPRSVSFTSPVSFMVHF